MTHYTNDIEEIDDLLGEGQLGEGLQGGEGQLLTSQPGEDDQLGEDEDQQLYEHFRFEADPGQQPMRVDKFMCEKLQHSSRNRIQKAADAGFIHVNDKPVKSNYKVRRRTGGSSRRRQLSWHARQRCGVASERPEEL